MRYFVVGVFLGFVVSATLGCGGSDAPEAVATNTETGADAGTGGPPPGAPAGMMGGAPAGMQSGPPAGMQMGGPPAGMQMGGADGSSGGPVAPGDSSGASSYPGGAAPPPLMSAGGGIGGGDADSSAGTGGADGLDTGISDSGSSGGADGLGGADGISGDLGVGGVPGGGPPGGAGYAGSGPPGAAGGAGYSGGPPPGVAGGAGTSGGPPTGIPGGAGYPGSGSSAGTEGELGVAGGPPGQFNAAPKPETLDGKAQQAFQMGKEREAIQYLNAWALSSDEGAAEVLSGIQWVPGLRRPTMAVRWGVGIQLAAPPRFSGDAKPIGSRQAFGTGRERRPGGGGSGGAPGGELGGGEGGLGSGLGLGGAESGGGFGGGRDSAISQYAGEFGSMILERFQSRVSGGKFGKALKNAGSGGARSGGGGIASAGGYGGSAGGGAEGLASAGSLDGPGSFEGPPGGIPGARAMPGGGGFGGAGGGAAGVLSTGLTLLGTGSDKELREKAREADVDVLAIFKVKLAVNRAGFVNNDTEIVLVDPVKGKELYNSGTLNNIKVQKDREQNKDDGVEKEVNKLFEYIDKDLTVTSLPSILTPEIVKTSRVEGQLLAGEITEPLAVLAEIRFYNRNKLLSDDDMAAAFAKVAGTEDAKTLLEGKEEERKKVVEKWLPQG